MLKVDFHLHSAEDPIDRISYNAFELVDRAAELGFDALAITLHDAQLESARVQDRARERGLTLIRGVERTIHGRHLLMLDFPANEAMAVASLDDVARAKARCGGMVVAPHPYFPGRSCLGSALDAWPDLFDAVEWSYFWTRALDFNSRAARWAEAHGKPLVGNSDLHDIRQLGRTYSLVDAQNDPAAICEAVRAGRVEVRTEPVPYGDLIQVFGGMTLRGLGPRSNRQAAGGRLSGHAGPALRVPNAS